MRAIDGDALFKTFEEHGWYNNADRDEIAERLLLEQPTIDVIPISWIKERIENAINAKQTLIAQMWLELIDGYMREKNERSDKVG